MFQLLELIRFYFNAVTRYQLQAPFASLFAEQVIEDGRHYYAFDAIEDLRAQMLRSKVALSITDYGAGPSDALRDTVEPTTRQSTIREVARSSGSTEQQGQRLFRLANLMQPKTILEMGTSLGIGTAYIASGSPNDARFVSLEGCSACAIAAKEHLSMLSIRNVDVRIGPFEHTLKEAISDLSPLDFVYFDGNHRREATLTYFAACLERLSPNAVLIFDDVHWSKGMSEAWKSICAHPKVTLTIDCWDFACAFVSTDFKVKQHWSVVPVRWKPWMALSLFG
jgi:predicted O-methyltransferase YrrM